MCPIILRMHHDTMTNWNNQEICINADQIVSMHPGASYTFLTLTQETLGPGGKSNQVTVKESIEEIIGLIERQERRNRQS